MVKSEIPGVYVDLSKRFVDGLISANEYSLAVVGLYKRESRFFRGDDARAMNDLFYAAEAYCDSDELRDESDLDRWQLGEVVRDFLAYTEGVSG